MCRLARTLVARWRGRFAPLAAVLLLAGCTIDAVVPPADVQPGDAPFRVGLVTDVGGIDDRSFNQSAWEGVLAAADTLGLTADADFGYIETTDPKDYARNIEQLVDSGYDVVVTVGFALGEATMAAARGHPGIDFIGVDQLQDEVLPNLTGLVFREDQAGFLAGMLTAGLSQTGTVAAVLGTDAVPPVVAFGEGFALGARHVTPDIGVVATYHPGDPLTAFNDPEWGAAVAHRMLDQEADVVFAAGGDTGNGALREVAAASGAGTAVFCIGVEADQWHTLPEARPCLVSSALRRIAAEVAELIAESHAGTFPAGNHWGAVGLADFHDHAGAVSPTLRDQLADAAAGFDNGTLDTGYER